VGLLLLPLVALVTSSSPDLIATGLEHRLFLPALWLSAQTTLMSLTVILILGTPLAWWIANSPRRRTLELIVDVPLVLPPAVVGLALLHAFGRNGLLGGTLDSLGIQLSFTTAAVVIAQVVVAGPLFIQSAATAFRRVDPDVVLVARTLGQTRTGAFFRVVLPAARPGLLAGAALSAARALGEFGATLLFAGNMPGTTQTAPLAIYNALESDVRVATALALVLAAAAVILLMAIRAAHRRHP
jgi:molybdate transport system permease protein